MPFPVLSAEMVGTLHTGNKNALSEILTKEAISSKERGSSFIIVDGKALMLPLANHHVQKLLKA